jgi:hypothetical protein
MQNIIFWKKNYFFFFFFQIPVHDKNCGFGAYLVNKSSYNKQKMYVDLTLPILFCLGIWDTCEITLSILA